MWYVMQVISGQENRAVLLIEKLAEEGMLERCFVPMRRLKKKFHGEWSEVTEKIFPGYVLIHMVMNDDTWYVVRNTRGVTGFVGPGSKPVPLTDEEMAGLGAPQDVVVGFEVGDTIVVTSGAWKDTVGVVRSINEGKKTLTINVEMFSRETSVELAFTDVKKM